MFLLTIVREERAVLIVVLSEGDSGKTINESSTMRWWKVSHSLETMGGIDNIRHVGAGGRVSIIGVFNLQ